MELRDRNSFERENLASVDISEDKEKYIIKYVCRDMEARDFDVSVCMDMLTIKGNRKNGHHFYFEHEFQLPAYLFADKAKATFVRDILKISFPKAEEAV